MSPTTPRAAPRAPEPPARRGRPSRRPEIFAAALRLFRERGFHATSINEIGAAAGVTGTAIYSHFATKQELLAEAIREGAGRIEGGMREALAGDAPSPEAALERLVRAYVATVLDNADMNACYMLESRNLDPDVGQPLLRKERGLRDTWRERLVAVRPELSADQARTMVQMAIFSIVALCVHRTRTPRAELVEQATAFVLGALQGPVPSPHS
ncbi:MAG: TetR/AcrR family transcriptional regulator [Myxococcota bacterium]|nr:TetR/AcrR family transcriptional regulator [Myxococcota bacterium]